MRTVITLVYLAFQAVALPCQAPAKPAAEIAIERAFAWLKSAARPDGAMHAEGQETDAMQDLAGTALAMLALRAEGNTLRVGDLREYVRRGSKWLTEQQTPQGMFGLADAKVDAGDAALVHGLATLAMTEVWKSSECYRPYQNKVEQALAALAIQVDDKGKLVQGDVVLLSLGVQARGLCGGTKLEGKVGAAQPWRQLLAANSREDGGVPWYGPPPAGFGDQLALEELAVAATVGARLVLGDSAKEDGKLDRSCAMLVRAVNQAAKSPARIDGLLLLFGAAAARSTRDPAVGKAWAAMIEKSLLAMQRGDGSFDFASGLRPLRGPVASTSCALMALRAASPR